MATDKLVPAFFRVLYHSSKAPHVATFPLRGLVGEVVGEVPDLLAWDDTTPDADSWIESFIDLWGDMVASSLTFDRYQIFSQADNETPPLWIYEKAYSVVGSATITAGQVFAVQHTMTYRSTVGGIFKHVTLDRMSGGFWGRSYVPSAIEQDMINFLTAGTNAISARDNGRPISFLRLTVSENDRLAREYHQQLS